MATGSDWNRRQQEASRRRSPAAGGAWAGPEDRRLMEMHSAGRSHMEIAAVLGRTWNAVQQRLTKLRRQGRIPPA